MKKIIMSAGTLVFAGALVVSATGAFFSDVETSTANVFTAGSIDLKIDNESYALDFNIPGFENPQGNLVSNPANSWELADLIAGTHKFFDFTDVKPGDYGEDTISVHVEDNDAWLCAAARITEDHDGTYSEPELADDLTQNLLNPELADGELDNVIQFAFWADDGDNVFESDEEIFLAGPLSGLGAGGKIALADTSNDSVFGQNMPIPGDTTVYIGKIWCAGTLTPNAVAQDGFNTGSPVTLGTGFTCDGSGVNNASQTDVVEGDMQFYAVQSRNNEDFTCAADYTPTWPVEEEEIDWVESAQTGGDATEGPGDTPHGDNLLVLTTIDDVNSRVRYSYDIADIDLSAFTGFSYDSKQVSANDMVNGNASFRLVVDLDGDLMTGGDVKDVTYEPYYNIVAHNPLNDASITPGAWQNWAATMANGKFWASGVTTAAGLSGGGGAYATNFTIQQLLDAYPNAKILGISIGMGTWNVNQVVHVDNLIFNGNVLGFE